MEGGGLVSVALGIAARLPAVARRQRPRAATGAPASCAALPSPARLASGAAAWWAAAAPIAALAMHDGSPLPGRLQRLCDCVYLRALFGPRRRRGGQSESIRQISSIVPQSSSF